MSRALRVPSAAFVAWLGLSACGTGDPSACSDAADCGSYGLTPAPPHSAAADGPSCAAGGACAGYTLISFPESDASAPTHAKLLDLNGTLVHEWSISGFPARMLPGGSVVGCSGTPKDDYDCAELQQRSWDGELELSYSTFTFLDSRQVARQHHDWQREGSPVGYYAPGQAPLATGKTLLLAHQRHTVPQIRDGELDDDVIYEIGNDGKRTTFEWQASDHFDELGFDDAARHDLATREANVLEWLHGNSVSRVGPNHWFDEGHSELDPDNIIYSSRNAALVVILDHSTGEVVWRMGPDFQGRPEQGLGQFSGQHHPHIIPRGLPGAGNMLVFDNGGPSGYGGDGQNPNAYRYARNYSRVVELDPITFELIWEYGSEVGDDSFYSEYVSSAQRLPNGNTLITVGVPGKLIEVTPDKRVVWQYQNEDDGGPPPWVYRAYRVPPEWLPPGENELHAGYPSWAEQSF